MNFNDIQRVNLLSNEKLGIQAALAILATGGRITAMTVSGGDYNGLVPSPLPGGGGMPGMQGMPVTVDTHGVEYPPAMVEAIKTALQPRLAAITEELAKLGVTGMEQAQRASR